VRQRSTRREQSWRGNAHRHDHNLSLPVVFRCLIHGTGAKYSTTTEYILNGDTLRHGRTVDRQFASGVATGTAKTRYVHPDHLGSHEFGASHIQHTVRYTELAPTRFKTFLARLIGPARLIFATSISSHECSEIVQRGHAGTKTNSQSSGLYRISWSKGVLCSVTASPVRLI
jgi:hypothetical protein